MRTNAAEHKALPSLMKKEFCNNSLKTNIPYKQPLPLRLRPAPILDADYEF
jgi:hypothetical protein